MRPLEPTNVAVEARVNVTLGSRALVLAKSRFRVGRTVGYKDLMVMGQLKVRVVERTVPSEPRIRIFIEVSDTYSKLMSRLFVGAVAAGCNADT